jgi:hypothetical protein
MMHMPLIRASSQALRRRTTAVQQRYAGLCGNLNTGEQNYCGHQCVQIPCCSRTTTISTPTVRRHHAFIPPPTSEPFCLEGS